MKKRNPYENQNPQYIALMEKIEAQEKIIRELKKNYDFACEYNKFIVNALNSTTDEIREFERLPWYKKIRYKFKLNYGRTQQEESGNLEP